MEVFAFIAVPQYFYPMIMNGNTFLESLPQRIVSLVPSQTELLFDLGLDRCVAGITKFCIHPKAWTKSKLIVGGTKNINVKKIASCKPDLVIANKEENVQEQVAALAAQFPVLVTDISSLESAILMIEQIGAITGRQQKAGCITETIRNNFLQLQPVQGMPRTVYLIWRDPYMTVGGDSFINDMLQMAGFKNVFGHQKRYPAISIETIQQSNCELLLLSSEPYPFKQHHLNELQQLLPHTRIVLVDGEMFSWYGSRLMRTPAYLKTIIEQL